MTGRYGVECRVCSRSAARGSDEDLLKLIKGFRKNSLTYVNEGRKAVVVEVVGEEIWSGKAFGFHRVRRRQDHASNSQLHYMSQTQGTTRYFSLCSNFIRPVAEFIIRLEASSVDRGLLQTM